MSVADILRKRIVERLQRFEASREPRHEIVWGLLGDVDGTVSVPNQVGKVYCRLLGIGSNLVRAWNSTMPLVANLRVDVEVERQEGMPDDYTVLGVSRTGYGGYIDDTRNYVPPHHETHEYSSGVGGYDIVNVYTRMLAELRADAQATPDMTLSISAGLYLTTTGMVNRAAANSPAFSAAPAAGLVRYDLLYLDIADNQYKIAAGTAAQPGIATRPLPSADQIPIVWVFIQNGDTAITNSMLFDARVFLLPIGAFRGTHALLSGTHSDTLADTVVDGDVPIGNVTPKWSRLAISIPAANIINVLGVGNGELRPSWKSASADVSAGAEAILKSDAAGDLALHDLTLTGYLVLPKTSGMGIRVDTAAPTFGWRDITGEITNAGGANKPTSQTYRGGIDQFQFAAGDESIIRYHIPHDYVPGTDIHLHVHWSHISDIVTGGTITFTVEASYAKGHNQAAFSAPVTDTFIGTASTTQYQHIVSEVQFSASSPSGLQLDTDDLEPDGVILIRLEMTTNNITSGGAVPDPFIHEVDVHYQSTNIGTKDKAPDFYA